MGHFGPGDHGIGLERLDQVINHADGDPCR